MAVVTVTGQRREGEGSACGGVCSAQINLLVAAKLFLAVRKVAVVAVIAVAGL